MAKLLSSDVCQPAREEITGRLAEVNERFCTFKTIPKESGRFSCVVATLDPVVAERVTLLVQQDQANDIRATW